MAALTIWKVEIEHRSVFGIRCVHHGLAKTATEAGKKALALAVAAAKDENEKPRPRLAVHSIQNIATRDF